jgi:exopolysaccharide biosynthesis polyprenyl glycosylphosphotransferase
MVGVLPLAEAVAPDGESTALAEAVTQRDVHRVVIAAGTESQPAELEAIQAAKALGVKVSVLPRVFEVVGSSATFDYVDGITLLGVPRFGLSRPAKLAKRCFDLAGSTAILLLAGPVMLAIAAAIKLDSRGPVFFRQTRIGRSGHPFSVLKFRSMRKDADALKESLRDRNEQDDGLFKIADDPRVTRVGRMLRRTSLDELPQLLNVLRGEMSLVGPRPLVPEEDRQIRGWHRRRLQLTPGMTGPWQVLGSARIPLHEMVTLDYLYVANWSLWSDAKILLRTVDTVLSRRGR